MYTTENDIDKIELPAQCLDAFLRVYIFMLVFQCARHHHHVDVIGALVAIDYFFKGREILDDQYVFTLTQTSWWLDERSASCANTPGKPSTVQDFSQQDQRIFHSWQI